MLVHRAERGSKLRAAFTLLENGYRKINAVDFLLNERALEEIIVLYTPCVYAVIDRTLGRAFSPYGKAPISLACAAGNARRETAGLFIGRRAFRAAEHVDNPASIL